MQLNILMYFKYQEMQLKQNKYVTARYSSFIIPERLLGIT